MLQETKNDAETKTPAGYEVEIHPDGKAHMKLYVVGMLGIAALVLALGIEYCGYALGIVVLVSVIWLIGAVGEAVMGPTRVVVKPRYRRDTEQG